MTVPRLWVNPGYEYQLWQGIEDRRREFDTALQGMQVPGVASRMVGYAQRFAGVLSPGVMYGLSAAGVEPYDDVAEAIAAMDLRRALDVNPAAAIPPGARINGEALRRRTPLQVRGKSMADTWSPDDPLKAAVRGAFTVLSALPQEASAAVVSGVAALADDEPGFFDQAWENYTTRAAPSELRLVLGEFGRRITRGGLEWSDPVQATRDLFESEEFIGSGWIPGGRVREVREEQKRNLYLPEQTMVDPEDRYLTPGRALMAFLPIEPGTRPYNLLSGISDLGFTLATDPTTYIAGGAGSADNLIGGAIRTGADAARILPEARQLSAAVRPALLRGPRRTVDAQGAQWALTNGNRHAARVVGWLARESDPYRIRRLMHNKVDAETADALARASDPQAVLDELLSVLGSDAAPPPTGRPASLGRPAPTATAAPPRDWSWTPPEYSARDWIEGTGATYQGPRPTDAADELAQPGLAPAPQPLGGARAPLIGLPNVSRVATGTGRRHRIAQTLVTDARWAQYVPKSTRMGLESLEDTADAVYAWGRNVGLSDDVVSPLASRALRIDPNDPGAWDDLYVLQRDVVRAAQDRLKAEGVEAPILDKLTEIVQGDIHEHGRFYIADEMGRHTLLPGARYQVRVNVQWSETRIAREGEIPVLIGDDIAVLPSPGSLSQLADDVMALPDWRKLRDVATKWSRGLNMIPGVQTGRLFAAEASKFWTQLMLSRIALPIRNMMDNQARMAIVGLPSMITHPTDFLALVLNKRAFRQVLDGDDNGFAGLDEFQASMNQLQTAFGPMGHVKPAGVESPLYAPVHSGHAQALEGWAHRLANYANDPIISKVAELGPQKAADWLWNGAGRQHLDRLNLRVARGEIHTQTGARIFADAYWDQIQQYTSGNPHLVSGIARGEIGGFSVVDLTTGQAQWDEAVQALVPFRTSMPKYVPVIDESKALAGRPKGIARVAEAKDEVFRRIFESMSKIEDKYAREPVFRESYFRELERLAPWMPRDLADEMAGRAVAAGFKPRDEIVKNIRSRGGTAANQPILDPDQAAALAAQRAADVVLELLYDSTRRKQWTEAARIISPFAEPYRNVWRTYGRLLLKKPKAVSRARQAYVGARESDIDGDGRGFFFQDERGTELFAYPSLVAFGALSTAGAGLGRAAGRSAVAGTLAGAIGSRIPGLGGVAGSLLQRAAPAIGTLAGLGAGAAVGHAGTAALEGQGAHGQLVGRVSGLNVVMQSFGPGVGPSVTIPASFLQERTPQLDWLWKRILPMGREPVEAGLLESQLPAWLVRFRTALSDDPESLRLFGNTVGDMMNLLAASGEYLDETGMAHADAGERLLEEATRRSSWAYFLRGAAQFILPTGPQVEFRADTPDGVIAFSSLAGEYRRLREEHGEDVAFHLFTERFGTNLGMLIQPKSSGVNERSLGPTGAAWERQHPELVDAYRSVIGYLAPQDPDNAPLDTQAYNRAIQQGDRVSLTPEQQLAVYNNTVGRLYYQGQVAQMGRHATTQDGKAFLQDLRADLMEHYPGYLSNAGVPEGDLPAVKIETLRRAVGDERIREASPAGLVTAIEEYLRIRDTAINDARALGGRAISFQTAEDPRIVEIRDDVRQQAAELMEQYPDFAAVWRGVFQRELADDVGTVRPEPTSFAGLPTWQRFSGIPSLVGVR